MQGDAGWQVGGAGGRLDGQHTCILTQSMHLNFSKHSSDPQPGDTQYGVGKAGGGGGQGAWVEGCGGGCVQEWGCGQAGRWGWWGSGQAAHLRILVRGGGQGIGVWGVGV
jgi:hypothetical protein